MGWLLLTAFGIVWAGLLLATDRRRSPNRTVEDFERGMDMLADTDRSGRGRWIVTPRKGVPFVGPTARAQARARVRRRKILVFLLESIVITFMIGVVPPLRPMWYATLLLVGLLGGYVWMLLSIKQRGPETPVQRAHAAQAVPARPRQVRERFASDAAGRMRPAFNGLGALGSDDLINIVVKPVGDVGAVRV